MGRDWKKQAKTEINQKKQAKTGIKQKKPEETRKNTKNPEETRRNRKKWGNGEESTQQVLGKSSERPR